MKRTRTMRAIALAAVAVIAMSVPVSAGTAYRKLTSTMDYTTIYATIIHDGAAECDVTPTWYYRVKYKVLLGSVTTTSFHVNDVWVTYEVVRGTAFANLFFITGSYDRWPTTGTKWQGDYIGPGRTKTYYYDVNKTFRKDGAMENRSSYSDPGICDNWDHYSLYLY